MFQPAGSKSRDLDANYTTFSELGAFPQLRKARGSISTKLHSIGHVRVASLSPRTLWDSYCRITLSSGDEHTNYCWPMSLSSLGREMSSVPFFGGGKLRIRTMKVL